VRTSWRPRNAQVSVVLAAGLIVIAGGVLPGRFSLVATSTATPTPTPTPTATVTPGATVTPSATATAHARGPHQATRARSPAGPVLTISVSDGRTAANPGDQLTYLVSVRDGGTASASHLKITQTLSAGLDLLSASPHGIAADGRVTWPAAIPAGGTKTFRVVARVTQTPARLLRLAAVACASAAGSSRPIVCAAHLDRLPAATAASASRAAGTSGAIPVAYAAVALAVLAVAVLAVITRRRAGPRRS
jgi:uncharacterized repeat protein (TIGR01451 family)